MPHRKLSPALEQKAREELNEDPARVPEDINTIKEWLAKQPHINANEDDDWIISFLRGCKFSIEKTKEKIDAYYTARSMLPEVLIGADPAKEVIQEYLKIGFCWALKQPVAPDGELVVVYRPGALNLEKHNLLQMIQINLMIIELLQLESDNLSVAGLRVIVDMDNLSMAYIAQFSVTLSKQLAKWSDRGLPVRYKGMHYINASSGMETLNNILSRFLSSKLSKRVHIHGKNSDGLYEFVPRHLMPKEYGGDAGTVAELVGFWKDEIMKHRDYFINAANYKTDESKRVKKLTVSETDDLLQGSFRSLKFD